MNVIAFIFICIGQLLFILNWILDKEISFLGNYVSDYVHTKHGHLSYLGFLLTGTGSLLATNIYFGSKAIIDIELFFYGIMLILLGIFPVDKKRNTTIAGVIHSFTAHLCFNSFVVIFTILIIKRIYTQIYIIILISITYISGLLIIFLPAKYKGIFQKTAIFSQFILIQILLLIEKPHNFVG